MSLPTKIVIGLVGGVVIGMIANYFGLVWLQDALQFIEPVGTAWIQLITMVVIPLVVASLMLGTAWPRVVSCPEA